MLPKDQKSLRPLQRIDELVQWESRNLAAELPMKFRQYTPDLENIDPRGGQINFLQKEHLLDRIFSFLHRGGVEVREWPSERFSVIRSEFPFNHFLRNIACKGHRILEVHKVRDGYT